MTAEWCQTQCLDPVVARALMWDLAKTGMNFPTACVQSLGGGPAWPTGAEYGREPALWPATPGFLIRKGQRRTEDRRSASTCEDGVRSGFSIWGVMRSNGAR